MSKELSEMTLEELWQLFPIMLKEHNPNYKHWYEIEKKNILNYIDKKNIIRINHIGSTSVEGLIAKPTIDILLEINKECDIEQIKYTLIDSGWLLMSFEDKHDMRMVFNKGYTKHGFAEKVYHLHVRYYDNWNELYFRDYLIEHKEIVEEYGQLKLELIKAYKHDRDGYTNAKSDFILKYTKKAKEEYGDRYISEK